MGDTALSNSPTQQYILRSFPVLKGSILVLLLISVICTGLSINVELNSPGEGAISHYADLAWASILTAFLISIPILYVRVSKSPISLKNIEDYFSEDSIKQLIIRNRFQILLGIIYAIFLYLILTTYFFTPELQAKYIAESKTNIITLPGNTP